MPRPQGICPDYLGRCPVPGLKVTVYGDPRKGPRYCRKCYDRKRNTDFKSREEMPDITPPLPNGEERELQVVRKQLFEVFDKLTATDEEIDTVMGAVGHYFRPLQLILEREKIALDVLYKHVPAIVEVQPQPQQASTGSTDSTEPKKSRLLSKQVGATAATGATGTVGTTSPD